MSVSHEKPVYEIRAGALGRIGLGELWENRHLAVLLAWRNIRVRYKQTVLGVAWALLAPVAYTLIFVLFFQLAPVAPTGVLPYVPTVFASMILWQFFSRGLADGGTSLSANANLITKVYFPRLLKQHVRPTTKRHIRKAQCLPDLIQPEEIAAGALFLSDNNFSALQKTQFLLFEIIP